MINKIAPAYPIKVICFRSIARREEAVLATAT